MTCIEKLFVEKHSGVSGGNVGSMRGKISTVAQAVSGQVYSAEAMSSTS